ncbi:MAG: hypothetical protein PHX04_04820 [Bacilli bacterium]|nr:hypothetical protein [Bacilli bacterium]
MGSRMDKYGIEKPELKSRTELNKDLYVNNEFDDYNKMDLNSNVSVLGTADKNIDVDQIREILDKKYRDNAPKRKSIAIDMVEEEVPLEKIDTKEYDINEILAKAKSQQNVDYNIERLKKLRNTNFEILQKLNLESEKSTEKQADENELMTLINTITKLELENQEKASKDAVNLLNLENTEEMESPKVLENSFYTGNLAVTEKDYEDFSDIQKDIKSNSFLIKFLIVIFILVLISVAIFMLNKYLNWELF